MKQIKKLIQGIGKKPSWKMVVHDAELKALWMSICNTIPHIDGHPIPNN
jgi:hypothetical protein